MSTPAAAPTLVDGDVTIRALRASDAEGCLEQCLDPESARWTNAPVPYTRELAMDYCTGRAEQVWADGSEWLFAIDHAGRYAGNIALKPTAPGSAEIAFGAHPDARGTGVVQRALRLLLAWGFEERGLESVVWHARVGNWASRKTAWRLGFTLDGVLRHHHVLRGELGDGWLGTLLADDAREPRHAWLEAPVLHGDGVRLRPVADGDVPRIVEACADERTAHWLGRMPVPYTPEDVAVWRAAMTEKQAEGTGTTWAVVDPDSDLLLGSLSVFGYQPGLECELGWWMHPAERGQGVMTRAVAAVLPYAFAGLGVKVVRAGAAVGNTASRRVMEANGLRQTGVELKGTVVRGAVDGVEDLALYALLASDWSAAIAATAAASVRR